MNEAPPRPPPRALPNALRSAHGRQRPCGKVRPRSEGELSRGVVGAGQGPPVEPAAGEAQKRRKPRHQEARRKPLATRNANTNLSPGYDPTKGKYVAQKLKHTPTRRTVGWQPEVAPTPELSPATLVMFDQAVA